MLLAFYKFTKNNSRKKFDFSRHNFTGEIYSSPRPCPFGGEKEKVKKLKIES